MVEKWNSSLCQKALLINPIRRCPGQSGSEDASGLEVHLEGRNKRYQLSGHYDLLHTRVLWMDPLFLAQSLLRRRRFDEAIDICQNLLERNPLDQVRAFMFCYKIYWSQAAWALKCIAFTQKSYIDDTEAEDEGIAEVLMDDNAIAQLPRYDYYYSREIISTDLAPHYSAQWQDKGRLAVFDQYLRQVVR